MYLKKVKIIEYVCVCITGTIDLQPAFNSFCLSSLFCWQKTVGLHLACVHHRTQSVVYSRCCLSWIEYGASHQTSVKLLKLGSADRGWKSSNYILKRGNADQIWTIIVLIVCFSINMLKHILLSCLAEIPYCYLPADHVIVSCFKMGDEPKPSTVHSACCRFFYLLSKRKYHCTFSVFSLVTMHKFQKHLCPQLYGHSSFMQIPSFQWWNTYLKLLFVREVDFWDSFPTLHKLKHWVL